MKKMFWGKIILLLFSGCLFLLPQTAGAISCRKVVDAAGRQIPVEKPFVRIISLYGAHTENLFALGFDKSIIGVAPHEVYPAAAKEKPVFSYHDGPEKFIAARPDLVLIRPMIDRGYKQLVKRLEKSGIVVVSLQPHGIDEVYEYWRKLGCLGGRPQAAEKMIADFKQKIALRQASSAQLRHKKKVYFEAIHRRMKTFAPGALALFCLKVAGGENVAADAVPVRPGVLIAPYGKERILAHAREIDVFLAQRGTMNRVDVATIVNEPGFKVIKAVGQHQVYVIDEPIISRPTPRLLEGIDRISRVLYPETAN